MNSITSFKRSARFADSLLKMLLWYQYESWKNINNNLKLSCFYC